VTILLVVLLVIGTGLLAFSLVPMMSQITAERQAERLRAEQRLIEARLQMLNQLTMQRMYDVVRQQRQDSGE